MGPSTVAWNPSGRVTNGFITRRYLRPSDPSSAAVCSRLRCRATGTVFEGVGHRDLGLHKLEPELIEVKVFEERRSVPESEDGRALVMVEPGQREFVGPATPADGISALNDQNPLSVAGKLNRGRKTIRSRADDDGVVIWHEAIQVDIVESSLSL